METNFVRDDASHAIAATTAGPAANDASPKASPERGEHNTALGRIKAAIDREPDDALAVEAVADIIMSDPLAAMLEIMDAENAEAALKAALDTLFGKLKRDGAHTKRRPPSWHYDWQPYCLALRKDGTWIMLGREYKKLGTVQSHFASAGWCDWNTPDHVVWEFDCGDPRELLGEGIFREASPNNHPKSTCLYMPFDDRDYGRRVARLVRATVDPPRYAMLLLSHCGFDRPPPGNGAALAA
jgi:hypothetical protein